MAQRTTLTLEDDVAARLRAEARRTGKSLRVLANEALRAGLERGAERAPQPFKVTPRNLGLREGVDLDDIAGLLDRIEGPQHR